MDEKRQGQLLAGGGVCVIHPNKPGPQGYPRVNVPYGAPQNERKVMYAHRWAWMEAYGPIPEGMEIHHICQEPRCVEPSHLLLVTKSQHEALHGATGLSRSAREKKRYWSDPIYREKVKERKRNRHRAKKTSSSV